MGGKPCFSRNCIPAMAASLDHHMHSQRFLLLAQINYRTTLFSLNTGFHKQTCENKNTIYFALNYLESL